MQREHESPLPIVSELTGTSRRSFEGVWSSSGSSRKEVNSTYESIIMSVCECGWRGGELGLRIKWLRSARKEGERVGGRKGGGTRGGKEGMGMDCPSKQRVEGFIVF